MKQLYYNSMHFAIGDHELQTKKGGWVPMYAGVTLISKFQRRVQRILIILGTIDAWIRFLSSVLLQAR